MANGKFLAALYMVGACLDSTSNTARPLEGTFSSLYKHVGLKHRLMGNAYINPPLVSNAVLLSFRRSAFLLPSALLDLAVLV